MVKLCAVIDAQGFQIGDQFYIRELCLIPCYSRNKYYCEVDIPISYENLNEKDKTTVNFCRQFVHGLPLETRVNNAIPHSDLPEKLRLLYELHRIGSDDKIGVKNTQLQKLLTRWGIPCIDLEIYLDCPPIKWLRHSYKMKDVCEIHTDFIRNKRIHIARCAEDKAKNLWQWLRYDFRLALNDYKTRYMYKSRNIYKPIN
jgi:hypothetical protein